MTVENADYVHQLDPTYPLDSDYRHEGDNHIRMIKQALKNTFPGADRQYDLYQIEQDSKKRVDFGLLVLWWGGAPQNWPVPDGWAIPRGQYVNRSDTGAQVRLPDTANDDPSSDLFWIMKV